MARFIKWAIVPAVLFAGLFLASNSAQAHEFYGRGYGYGFGNHCYQPRYPVYRAPVYPVYRQPYYGGFRYGGPSIQFSYGRHCW